MMRIDFSRFLTNSINVVQENGNQLVKPLDNKISKFALACFVLLTVVFMLAYRHKLKLKENTEKLKEEANKQPNPPEGIKSRLLDMIASGEVKEDNPKETTAPASDISPPNKTQPTHTPTQEVALDHSALFLRTVLPKNRNIKIDELD